MELIQLNDPARRYRNHGRHSVIVRVCRSDSGFPVLDQDRIGDSGSGTAPPRHVAKAGAFSAHPVCPFRRRKPMRHFQILLSTALALLCASISIAEDNTGKQDGEFISLFNGRDLSGWVVMGKDQGWKVTDGVIRSKGDRGGNWLRSRKQYRDFIYRVEWRVSKGGNSGVFIRSAKNGQPWITGYEVQISNAPRDDAHCTGSLYGYFPVKPRPDETHDKWHTFEIHCRGSRITVIADGVKCVDADQSKNDKTRNKPLEGYVGLQDSHSSDGHYIEYRKVEIKVLR